MGTKQIERVSGREVWASQPGALRVYDERGDFVLGAKLYSDSEMSVLDEAALTSDVPPSNWNDEDNLARYVDLNEPVLRREQIYFPILDPLPC